MSRAPSLLRAHPFAFGLFILTNAALYIRPADLFFEEDLPIYFFLIIACIAVSVRPLVSQLTFRSLAERPITMCVLAMPVAVALSHLTHFDFANAQASTIAVLKLAAYYLLLVGVVDSVARLTLFLKFFVFFIFITTGLGLLQYYGAINISALSSFVQKLEDANSVTVDTLLRLCSVGVFNNPNDLARILLIAMPLCLYCLIESRHAAGRALWFMSLILFGYALALTYSRGGFIGFLVCLCTLFGARFGWKKTFVMMAITLPVVFLVFQGRQTEMDFAEGTGQQRISLWSDGLQMLRQAPYCGIGEGMYFERFGYVAHNSFVQCYVELGILGGTAFLGGFYLPLRSFLQGSRPALTPLPSGMRRLHPFLAAAFAGYAVSLLSSSRTNVEQTYMLFGFGAIYFSLVAKHWLSDRQVTGTDYQQLAPATLPTGFRYATQWNLRLMGHLTLVSICVVVVIDLFIRLSAHYSG